MSLRTKLIFSHTAVVFLSLFLTGLALLLLLNRYRDQLLVSELQTRALEAGLQVARVLAEEREGNIEAALQRAAERFDVRLILIGEGRTVVWDSQGEGSLEGEPIDLELVSGFARRDPRRVRFGEEDFYLSLLPIPVRRLGGHAIAQVLPARQLPVGTLDLLMRLLGAGVIGFGVAVLLAVWIARSVSRPLAVLTRAAEEMAQGNYDQQIPAEGEDEIGRLAGAFNSMAQAVRSAQRAQHDFLANVSHDLKTPLTSIQGFTQAILDGTLKDQEGYREAARIIQEESIRMGRMVRHLLDLAKREAAPPLRSRRTSLQLESILSDCAASLQPRAQEKGLSLEVEVPPLP
ncbi:MAG: HAMP domain-containing histidine kinase, partial [Chloroflexi bacterium]|nr:HAMP domain-containing histidine kinase [Chloroflexota bacterium]